MRRRPSRTGRSNIVSVEDPSNARARRHQIPVNPRARQRIRRRPEIAMRQIPTSSWSRGARREVAQIVGGSLHGHLVPRPCISRRHGDSITRPSNLGLSRAIAESLSRPAQRLPRSLARAAGVPRRGGRCEARAEIQFSARSPPELAVSTAIHRLSGRVAAEC